MVDLVALKRAGWFVWWPWQAVHFKLVYLVTALVPLDTACLASSPGSRSLTAVLVLVLEELSLLKTTKESNLTYMRGQANLTFLYGFIDISNI